MCLEYRTVIENDSQQSVLCGKIAVRSVKASSQIANNRQQINRNNRQQHLQTNRNNRQQHLQTNRNNRPQQITNDRPQHPQTNRNNRPQTEVSNSRQQQTAHRADFKTVVRIPSQLCGFSRTRADFWRCVRILNQLCGLSADQKASFRAKNIENRSHWAENAEISLLSIRTTGLKSARQAKNPHAPSEIRTSCQKSTRIIQNPHAPSEIRTANPKSARHNKKIPQGSSCGSAMRKANQPKRANYGTSHHEAPSTGQLKPACGNPPDRRYVPAGLQSRPDASRSWLTTPKCYVPADLQNRPAKPTCKTDLQNRPAKPISRNVRKRNVRLPRSADC